MNTISSETRLRTARFRRVFAQRILGLLRFAALGPLAGCGGGGDATAGAGGSVPNAPYHPGMGSQCFAWPTDQPCPTSAPQVIAEFEKNACGATGWGVNSVESMPARDATGKCCYDVKTELCTTVAGGRPYLVDGRRTAASVRHDGPCDWRESAAPSLVGLDADTCAQLARAWAEDARLEHGSIASFARFSLALLAMGAPAELLAGAHDAAGDEVRHARLCFGLAAAYSGQPVAPGRFPLQRTVAIGSSLAELAEDAALEGCVGETVAALVAAEQLAHASDAAVRRVLATIAEDEARHAELAWRTVAWAIAAGGGEVRTAVGAAFDAALRAAPAPDADDGFACEAHGRLGAATIARVARVALDEVIGPCARALLAGWQPGGRRTPPPAPRATAAGQKTP